MIHEETVQKDFVFCSEHDIYAFNLVISKSSVRMALELKCIVETNFKTRDFKGPHKACRTICDQDQDF